jgi:uncharacterized membrane protein YgdD (TMEM256/DUF423 family)
MSTEKVFAALGALLAFAGVGAGAFGAHALRARLPPDLLAVFETAVRYQMYHALGLIGVSLLLARWPSGQLSWAGWLFVAGTAIFSGSLYLLALTGVRWWGAVTPLGGVCFLLGWLCVAWGLLAR